MPERRTFLKAAGAVGAASGLLAGCSQNQQGSNGTVTGTTSSGESVTLKIGSILPANHPLREAGIGPWATLVEELTNGQVTFEWFPGGQLGEQPDYLRLVQEKSAHIGQMGAGPLSDQIPLSTVGERPGAWSDQHHATLSYWRTANPGEPWNGIINEKEHSPKGVRPISVGFLSPYNILTKGVKVTSLDDWKGLKLRSAGGTFSSTIEMLGATPVEMPSPETTQAMRRGTIDGTTFPIPSIGAYDLQLPGDYMSTNLNLGTVASHWMINQETYDGLPEKVKRAMQVATEKTVAQHALTLQFQTKSFMEKFSSDIEFYQVPSQNAQNWYSELSPISDQWVSRLSDQGHPAQNVLDSFEENLDKTPLVGAKP